MNKQTPTNKRERFKRLATQRTIIVLKRLKVLGNCANRSASEIERKVRETKAKFHFPKNKDFKL
jgi:hypothetical protein